MPSPNLNAETVLSVEHALPRTPSHRGGRERLRAFRRDYVFTAEQFPPEHCVRKKDTRVNLLGNKLVLIAAKDAKIDHVTIGPGFDLAKLAGDGRIATGDVREVPVGLYAKASLVGLLSTTKRMTVFGTVHAPLFHPLIAAKEFVTADHIGEGRVGVNIVVGWNEGEFDMFGVKQREHDARYDYA
jgi:hypothetical protein